MKNTQRWLIIIQMGAVVPRNAIGYVANLSALALSPGVEADSLNMLRRYCPELVEKYLLAAQSLPGSPA